MPTVLLVEDDPVACRIHCLMLEKMGCKVECAVTGSQAIAMCANNYQLILLDCSLPDKDGFEVSKQIRQYEQINHIPPRPIIMLSAYPWDEELQAQCRLAGVNEFITKPISYDALQQRVRDYCPFT